MAGVLYALGFICVIGTVLIAAEQIVDFSGAFCAAVKAAVRDLPARRAYRRRVRRGRAAVRRREREARRLAKRRNDHYYR